MWSSDRRTLILALAALPLAGCGFSPALAPGAPAAGLRGRIRADDPANDAGLAFVTRLEERLGTPQAPGWRLAWTLNVRSERRGLTAGLGDSRGQMVGLVRWTLTPDGAEASVANGVTSRFVGYARTGSPLAIRSAAEDARRRVAEMLAEAVAAELIATAPRWMDRAP